MPDASPLRLRITRRRYSQFKANIRSSTPSEHGHLTDSGLLESAAFYRQMFACNRAVNLVIDPLTAQIIEANAAACDFYGYTSEQFKSLRVSDISILSEAELLADMQRTILQKGTTFRARHRLASGEMRDVEIFTGVFEFNNKNYLSAIIQNITDRKQAEKALRESEELHRLFTEHMPQTSVIMFNNELQFTLAKGDLLKRAGYVLEDIIGKTPQEVFTEDTLNFMLPLYRRVLQGETFTYERTAHGFAYQSHANPLKNADGEIVGGIFLSYDITEAKQAEAALRASENRFHTLVDLAPVGIIQTNIQGKRIFCNTHWCEMTGITLEQALSDENYQTIYADDLPIAAAAWDRMMESNLPFDNTIFRYQRPDKSTVWVSGNGRTLFDSQGIVIGYLGTVTDISHLKLLEDTLVVSESRFRTLIDFAPVGIVETDAQGSMILTNNQWSTLSGIPEEYAFTTDTSVTIHPDDIASVQATHQKMVETASSVDNLEYRFVHPDGKIIWVSDSSRPLFDPRRAITGHIITMTDITERKRLEEALRQNQEQMRLIADNIQDLIVYNDRDGNVIFVSPSSQTILGYEPQTLLSKRSIDLVHPDDLAHMIQTLGDAFKMGIHQFTVECRLRHADGHYINVETMGTLLRDDQTNYAGGVFISRDISERKRLQNLLLEKEKLQGALDKEHELSSLKTRMMERIAHEFRTPLTVIQATTETLTYYLDRLTSDQIAAKTVTIRGQIQRLTDMLQEIGLVINGRFSPDRVRRMPTDVGALCRDIASELERQLNRPGQYVLDLPETARVSLDPHVTRDAIQHIMRNAIRFSGASAVIKVSLSREENGITLRVTDNGIGIFPEEQSRIFEPFFRGSNIGEISGLGVGLTLARAAIEAQGGTITFESVLGQGTTVTIWLPV